MPNSFKKIPAEMRGFFCRLLIEKDLKNKGIDFRFFFFATIFLLSMRGEISFF